MNTDLLRFQIRKQGSHQLEELDLDKFCFRYNTFCLLSGLLHLSLFMLKILLDLSAFLLYKVFKLYLQNLCKPNIIEMP